ncbi:unnamed protein product [Oreochromis niloticus]|nr:unnamed protein product [Mustela putorius furo]
MNIGNLSVREVLSSPSVHSGEAVNLTETVFPDHIPPSTPSPQFNVRSVTQSAVQLAVQSAAQLPSVQSATPPPVTPPLPSSSLPVVQLPLVQQPTHSFIQSPSSPSRYKQGTHFTTTSAGSLKLVTSETVAPSRASPEAGCQSPANSGPLEVKTPAPAASLENFTEQSQPSSLAESSSEFALLPPSSAGGSEGPVQPPTLAGGPEEPVQPQATSAGGSGEPSQPQVSSAGGSGEPSQPQVTSAGGPESPVRPQVTSAGGPESPVRPQVTSAGGPESPVRPQVTSAGGPESPVRPQVSSAGGSGEPSQPRVSSAGGPEEPVQPQDSSAGGSGEPSQFPASSAGGPEEPVQPAAASSTPAAAASSTPAAVSLPSGSASAPPSPGPASAPPSPGPASVSSSTPGPASVSSSTPGPASAPPLSGPAVATPSWNPTRPVPPRLCRPLSRPLIGHHGRRGWPLERDRRRCWNHETENTDMSAVTASLCSTLLIVVVFVFVSADQKTITAESGQDVTLTCRAPNNNIVVVKWSRADLGDEYVLLYRDDQFVPDEQHPSFKNRVDLQDRQMKDGDVSLILNNVTINDTGTYECRVFMRGANRRKRALLKTRPVSIIYLSVDPPGQQGGDTEDGGKEAGGKEDGSVGLTVGLSVSAVFVTLAVGCFLIYNKK